jgi:hypothetical protein
VLLEMPNIHPVMQMKITANIKAADGKPIKQDVRNSIYKLAASDARGRRFVKPPEKQPRPEG